MKRFAAICALTMLVAACEAKSPLVPSPGDTTPPSSGMFTLTGTVIDGAGVPVGGAHVEAMGQVNCAPDPPYPGETDPPPCLRDQMFGAAETDTAGAFSIANLPAGYFTINVSKDGAVVSDGVNLQADSTVAFTLPGAPAAARPPAGRQGGPR
jgi:hypothetical protein